jgi:hypothetical protein
VEAPCPRRKGGAPAGVIGWGSVHRARRGGEQARGQIGATLVFSGSSGGVIATAISSLEQF